MKKKEEIEIRTKVRRYRAMTAMTTVIIVILIMKGSDRF